MYVTRDGAELTARAIRPRKVKRLPDRELNKPFPQELSVDWLHSQFVHLLPRNSAGSYLFKWEYLCSELLSKLPLPLYSSEFKRQAAIDKMLTTETTCRVLNRYGLRGHGFGYTAERFNTVLNYSREFISQLLGEVDLSIFQRARFSSGATTSRRRTKGDPWFKYNSNKTPLHVTRSAYPYATALIKCTPLWCSEGATLKIVPGNRITTVPKKTDIDRTIATEPDMNMSLQLAVGSYFRDQLLKAGIDLNDQTRNQRLAKVGSIDGSLATIDLSSASDSISCQLVKELLPHDWYAMLDDIRSQVGELPSGDFITWEKFSSMGNGFTFELESMIFYALSRSVIKYENECSTVKGDGNVDRIKQSINRNSLSVYGDDIICPSTYADSIISILYDCGFKTNVDKTFVRGPFRESCGKHYHLGEDVTPFYVKSAIDTVTRVIWLLNRMRSWAYDEIATCCDDTIWELYTQIRRQYIPKRLNGGKDIESSTSVCGPGVQKSRAIRQFSYRKINGVNAILRAFQGSMTSRDTNRSRCDWWYGQHGLTPVDIIWHTEGDVKYSETAMDKIVLDGPIVYRFAPNNDPWSPIPRFSKEI